jgi:hypothetical protein
VDRVESGRSQKGRSVMQVNTGSESGSASNVGGAGSAGTAPVKALKGLRLKLQQMLAGAQAVIPEGSSITTTAGSLTKAAIVKMLTDELSEFQAVDAGVTALGVARVQLRDDLPEIHAIYTELKDALSAQFGRRNPLLAQFGLKPQQVRKQLTPEQRVARAAKARQTRLLRHTGGVRQKAAVQYQGEVDVSTQLKPTQAASTPAAPSVDVSPGASTPGKPAVVPPVSTG